MFKVFFVAVYICCGHNPTITVEDRFGSLMACQEYVEASLMKPYGHCFMGSSERARLLPNHGVA
jgi:hypothetical protein